MNKKPVIIKQGRQWMVNNKAINPYELYAVWGQSPEFKNRYGKVQPTRFTHEHVQGYLKWWPKHVKQLQL